MVAQTHGKTLARIVLRWHIQQGRSATPNLRREGIGATGAAELEAIIGDLNGQMLAAAGEMKFELAARLRDELSDLKRDLRAMETAGHVR